MPYIIMTIAGAVFLTIGIFGVINFEPPIDPNSHGDRQIILIDGVVWIEEYVAFPGWRRTERFKTIEEARVSKEMWDKIRNPPAKEVIK